MRRKKSKPRHCIRCVSHSKRKKPRIIKSKYHESVIVNGIRYSRPT